MRGGHCARWVVDATVEAMRAQTADGVVIVVLDGHDRAQACATIASLTHAGQRVLAITEGIDLDLAASAFEAGAEQVLTTGQPLARLVDHLRGTAGTDTATKDTAPETRGREGLALVRGQEHRVQAAAWTDAQRFSTLTASEEAVLRDLMRGHSPEEISGDRFVALSTVRSQIRSILSKLGVNSQLAAVTLAFRSDWQEVRKLA